MNQKYPKFLELCLGAGAGLLTGTVKAALVDTAVYSFSSTHDFYNDVAAGVVGIPVTLTSKSITNGVFDAADFSFTGLTSTPSVEALVIFVENGGANTTWPLVAYIDTATGLPVAAGASQVDIVWDNGTNKIFKL